MDSIQNQNDRSDFKAAAKAVRAAWPGKGSVVVSYANKTIKIRCGYFYRHRSLEDWVRAANQKLATLPFDFVITDTMDNWQPWPRDSYYQLTVRVQ